MAKYDYGKINVSEQSKIVDDIYKDERFFSLGHDILSKIFLSNFIDNVYQKEFSEIKIEYEKISYNQHIEEMFGKTELPKIENEFYNYILRKELNLKFVPRDRKLELYNNAINDLNEIDKNIDELNKETVNKRIHKHLIEHYIAKNNKASEQIMSFLKKGIEDFIRDEITLSFMYSSPFPMSVPYLYSWNPSGYKLRYPTDIDNKFGDLLLDQYTEIANLYKRDKRLIEPFLENYISKNKCIDKIEKLLDSNHVLTKRKTLKEAIELFKTNKKRSFISIASLQIEGLFFDYCLELGLNPTEGEDYTLGKSLDFVAKGEKNFIDFEYYAFHLRSERNFSAHPKDELEDNAIELKSNILLLDILAILFFFKNENLKSNRSIQLINNYIKKGIELDRLIDNFDLFCDDGILININPFYANEFEKINDLREDLMKESFWSEMREFVTNSTDKEKVENLLELLNKFKKRKFEEIRTKDMIIECHKRISSVKTVTNNG